MFIFGHAKQNNINNNINTEYSSIEVDYSRCECFVHLYIYIFITWAPFNQNEITRSAQTPTPASKKKPIKNIYNI